jgi:hypothetical protein
LPRAEMDPHSWLESARLKLEAADLLFAKKDYGNAISSLQGADERIAKAVLLRLSFLQGDPVLSRVLGSIVGTKYRTPKALDHDWHVRFLEDLNPYIDTFEEIGTSFGIQKPGWRVTQYWRSKAPEFRRKVDAARKIKSKPSPRLKELTANIDYCTKLLDEMEASYTKTKDLKLKLPKSRQLDQPAKVALKRGGLPYIPREFRREMVELLLEGFKPKALGFAKNVKEIVFLVQVLVVLAAMNVFLGLHHQLGEYPTSQVRYDEKFPMVAKFADLKAFLDRSLRLAKEHVGYMVEVESPAASGGR